MTWFLVMSGVEPPPQQIVEPVKSARQIYMDICHYNLISMKQLALKSPHAYYDNEWKGFHRQKIQPLLAAGKIEEVLQVVTLCIENIQAKYDVVKSDLVELERASRHRALEIEKATVIEQKELSPFLQNLTNAIGRWKEWFQTILLLKMPTKLCKERAERRSEEALEQDLEKALRRFLDAQRWCQYELSKVGSVISRADEGDFMWGMEKLASLQYKWNNHQLNLRKAENMMSTLRTESSASDLEPIRLLLLRMCTYHEQNPPLDRQVLANLIANEVTKGNRLRETLEKEESMVEMCMKKLLAANELFIDQIGRLSLAAQNLMVCRNRVIELRFRLFQRGLAFTEIPRYGLLNRSGTCGCGIILVFYHNNRTRNLISRFPAGRGLFNSLLSLIQRSEHNSEPFKGRQAAFSLLMASIPEAGAEGIKAEGFIDACALRGVINQSGQFPAWNFDQIVRAVGSEELNKKCELGLTLGMCTTEEHNRLRGPFAHRIGMKLSNLGNVEEEFLQRLALASKGPEITKCGVRGCNKEINRTRLCVVQKPEILMLYGEPWCEPKVSQIPFLLTIPKENVNGGTAAAYYALGGYMSGVDARNHVTITLLQGGLPDGKVVAAHFDNHVRNPDRSLTEEEKVNGTIQVKWPDSLFYYLVPA